MKRLFTIGGLLLLLVIFVGIAKPSTAQIHTGSEIAQYNVTNPGVE